MNSLRLSADSKELEASRLTTTRRRSRSSTPTNTCPRRPSLMRVTGRTRTARSRCATCSFLVIEPSVVWHMPFRPAALARQRFGIVRIAAGAFEDLAALDLPETLRALANLRVAEARVATSAERLRERAFAAVRGCDDSRERRRLLKLQRDLFNGRRVDAPDDEAYAAAIADADAARETFLRAFDEEVAAARTKLHALAASET